jgi:hypothetical protein
MMISAKETNCRSVMVSTGFLNVLKPALSPTSMHITLISAHCNGAHGFVFKNIFLSPTGISTA